MDKKKGAEAVQTKHDKVKGLGGRWTNAGKQLKDTDTTIADFKEQLKQHEDAMNEMKPKLAAARTELDAAVEDLNKARKRDPDDKGEGPGDGEQMAEPVPGPTPREAQHQQASLAKAAPHPKGTEKPPAKTAPAAKKARTDGKEQDGDTQTDPMDLD